MLLLRKFFNKKHPDCLLQISERVYVFDCCFSSDVIAENDYKVYWRRIVAQLQVHFPNASFMVFNFREGEQQSQLSDILSRYDMTVMDYPRQFENCPLLPLEMIHHFLRSCESWLTLEGQHILLMHCERGGWPVLAFMLSGLLLYRNQYHGEQKTLEMVHKHAPKELLRLLSPINPEPSQVRYLEYISRRNLCSDWPPSDMPLLLDCLIIRDLPHFDGRKGCRPILRVYGQDPKARTNSSSILLFSTPKTKKQARLYQQEECILVKLDIQCRVQGDVVLECIHLHDDFVSEEMVFRIMFHTAFVRAKVLIVQLDEMDILWDAKDQFPKDFTAEVLFSGADSVVPSITTVPISEDENDFDITSPEEFFEVEEIFSDVIVDTASDDSEGKEVWKGECKVDGEGNDLDDIPNKQVGANEKVAGDSYGRTATPPPQPPPLLPPPPQMYVAPPPPPMHGGSPLPPPSPMLGGAPPPHPPLGGRAPGPPPPPGPRPPGGGPPPPPTFDTRGVDPKGAGRGRGLAHPGLKSSAQKKSSLKPLHWVKVTRPLQGSLWDVLQRHGEGQISPEFDISELETLFSATVQKPADKSGGRRKSVGAKPEKIQLIDLRRANNTEIMLTKVKMPLPDMTAAILAMDDFVLDVDQIENLIKFCPTKEEMELLKNYTGDKTTLGKCEQYFLELMKVPRVESKLRVFSFKIQFGTQMTEFKKSLNAVNSACEEVRTSQKLIEIMKYILYLGNILNQGTARGAALGFKLDTLLKLTDTRAANNKMTLMHYLCKVLASKAPVLLDFHKDLESLESASKIQLKSLAEEMQAIINGLEKLNQELAASESDGPVSQVFRKTLKDFIATAETEVETVTTLYCVVGRNADALAYYFGEDPSRCPFEQVTETLLNFIRLFKKAHEENVKQAELDKRKAAKEAFTSALEPYITTTLISKHENDFVITSRSLPEDFFKVEEILGGVAPPSLPPGPPSPLGPRPPPPPTFGARGVVPKDSERGRDLAHPALGSSAQKKSSLKQLDWVKVTRASKGSLWDELQRHGEGQIAPPEFDESEIETLFSATVQMPADESGGQRKSVGEKPEKVQLIDLRRANNTENMLTEVKMSLPDMMAAVMAMDDSLLDVDRIENLIKFCPTKEETELLKNYIGDKATLGKCEQYFLELMKVPRVESKLRVFSFKVQFGTQITKLKKSLNVVNSACEEVRTSQKLKEIMKRILYLGNTLNEGTARGAAVGFKLDSLLKLSDTRAANSNMTLLHYLCKVLASKAPILLDFHKELESLESASKIKSKSLAEEMQNIIKGLEKLNQELTASELDGPVSGVFRKTLKDFISTAETEVATVSSLYSVVGRNADALSYYFGEDPNRCPFEQVTATLLNFITLFKKAHEENVKQAEME